MKQIFDLLSGLPESPHFTEQIMNGDNGSRVNKSLNRFLLYFCEKK